MCEYNICHNELRRKGNNKRQLSKPEGINAMSDCINIISSWRCFSHHCFRFVNNKAELLTFLEEEIQLIELLFLFPQNDQHSFSIVHGGYIFSLAHKHCYAWGNRLLLGFWVDRTVGGSLRSFVPKRGRRISYLLIAKIISGCRAGNFQKMRAHSLLASPRVLCNTPIFPSSFFLSFL